MGKIVTYIGNYYRKNDILSEEEIQCAEYTIKAFLNEISKVIIFSIVFSLFGLFHSFLWVYLSFVTIRLFAGGIHCKKYFSCFVVSSVFIAACVFLPLKVALDFRVLTVIAEVSLLCPILLSPMTPSFRIIREKKKRWILKVLAIFCGCAWIIAAYFSKEEMIQNNILLSVIVSNYQLLFPAIMQALKKERRKIE